MDYVKLAKAMGFDNAGVMRVEDLVIVPEYRKLCERNTCGNYNKEPGCPPMCGELSDMVSDMAGYENALILKTVNPCNDYYDRAEQKAIQAKQNRLTLSLYELMKKDGAGDMLVMTAGPWEDYSCLSAYCINAQKMAEAVGMSCWKNDKMARYFSLILYK